jgi:hypothetical protein
MYVEVFYSVLLDYLSLKSKIYLNFEKEFHFFYIKLTLHWIPQSFSGAFVGFRIGEVVVDICSSIVDIDNLYEKRFIYMR